MSSTIKVPKDDIVKHMYVGLCICSDHAVQGMVVREPLVAFFPASLPCVKKM